MKARLFTIPSSHPSWSARLMLEHKGIDYSRIDLIAVVSKPILRAAGFPRVTVPALRIGGSRIQGSREIARELDRLVPVPALLPADPVTRAVVEEAELWGDEVFQPVPRRIVWNSLKRDRAPIRSYLEGARLGIPISLAAATAAPIVWMAARFNAASDERVRADLAALPAMLDRIDRYIESGVIGGEEPNAADFQIATSVALLLTLDDVAPALAQRPAAALAKRLVPGFPGRAPAALPPAWLTPLRASA